MEGGERELPTRDTKSKSHAITQVTALLSPVPKPIRINVQERFPRVLAPWAAHTLTQGKSRPRRTEGWAL